MFLFGKPTIAKELRRRGITLLLHSTHLYTNLPHILADAQLHSVRSLQDAIGVAQMKRFLHDPKRYEHFAVGLNFLNCSLSEPNYELLYKRSKSGWESEWVHFALDISLLSREDTLFSPVSAAQDKGAHVRSGLAGFQSLFNDIVDRSNRSELGRNLPTHPQAEVLIKGPLPLSSVTAIHVCSQPIHDEVSRLAELHHRPIQVLISPHLFIWPARLIKK